jgi:hypothetical protein
MKDERGDDPFADDVVRRIDPRIRDSLTPAQISAIKEALSSPNSGSYTLDLRGVIPLFFARYYIVFLIGRDFRPGIQIKEGYRRQRYSLLAGLAFAVLLSLPILLLVLVLLYFL